MKFFTDNLAFLQAGIGELETYLLSKELYWPLGVRAPRGEPPFPHLTLGWLLLALSRGRGQEMSGAITRSQSDKLSRLAEEIDAVRGRWQVAWGNKAEREFHNRLTLWKNFVNGYRSEPAEHATRYRYEVQRRMMLDLLSRETDELPKAELELLMAMDEMIEAVFIPGDFIWEKELAGAFPQEAYWYLYGGLDSTY